MDSLASFTDITSYLNSINLKLQGEDDPIKLGWILYNFLISFNNQLLTTYRR